MTKKFDAKKFAQLHQKIIDFYPKRGWNPSADNVVKSIVIEAAELLEHFQLDNAQESFTKENIKNIGYEMADVIWYVFQLAHILNINLTTSMADKFDIVNAKYPVEKFQKGFDADFYYQQKAKYREGKK